MIESNPVPVSPGANRTDRSYLQLLTMTATMLWSRMRWMSSPLLAFGISRLAVLLAVYAGWLLFPQSSDPAPYHLRPPTNIITDALGSRWDTGFYVSIVEEGYIAEGVPLPSVAFFPLFPILMKAIRPLVGGDAVTAGLVVADRKSVV